MTDPMDDLRQASADVSGVEVLSPAAQAILDAFRTSHTGQGCLAAALRAAVDQVIPEEPLHGGDQRWMYERDARQSCRKKLLAIADELEGQKQLTKESD